MPGGGFKRVEGADAIYGILGWKSQMNRSAGHPMCGEQHVKLREAGPKLPIGTTIPSGVCRFLRRCSVDTFSNVGWQ
eukprot:56209-Eustigmatos_ZCMA.PRE.1